MKRKIETVEFDRDKYNRLKHLYETTTNEVISFEGNEFLRGYCKYLLDYLGNILK